VTTAARNVVNWGRACGLAELALQPARRYPPAPVSSFLSVDAACWISGLRKERHSQERGRGYIVARPIDGSLLLATMSEEGRAAVCRVGRGRDMRRRPAGPPPFYLFGTRWGSSREGSAVA
jgi:hypothetical protein